MSRVRTRPTRDDTRDKLFEAAARVFEEQGIGGASIEIIAAAAGFTRGAFLFEFQEQGRIDHRHARGSRRAIDSRDCTICSPSTQTPADFIDALKTMDRSRAGSARPLSPPAHGNDPVRGACRKAQTRTRQAPARPAKTGHRHRRDHGEEQRHETIPESDMGRRDPAGAGGRFSPASPDRSGDHAGRQLLACDQRSAKAMGILST